MRSIPLILALPTTAVPAVANGNMGCKTFTAQCQMALNVPIWRKISDECVSSSLSQRHQPTLYARLVDAHVGLAISQPRIKRQVRSPLCHRSIVGKTKDL